MPGHTHTHACMHTYSESQRAVTLLVAKIKPKHSTIREIAMAIVQVCAWTHKLSSHKAEEAVNTQVLCSNKGSYIQMNKHERKGRKREKGDG